jgi:hypothetical protein
MRSPWAGRASALLLAAALAFLAAGCGGGGGSSGGSSSNSKPFSTYETSMQALGARLSQSIRLSGLANRNASKAKVATNLRHVQVELRAAATELAKITPPANVRAAHRELIRGVREYADELSGVIANVEAKGPRRALPAIVTLKGIRDMATASQKIAKAGYIITVG